MPKSSKKKKEKVADFSKARLKLGKGKATPTNAIDTSFKARSIALPSQSIAAEKDISQPITRRQLTFNDLISHLRHYNAGTRKDALIGLRELFDANWELVGSCLTPLVNAVVRLIGDEDASVRKQLLSFMAWLLPRIPPEDLTPHSPSLLLFTTSAQTHIFPEIRIDAIKFLDILLECIPDSVIAGWCGTAETHGSLVLGGYLGVLNAGTRYGETDGPLKATSTASVVLTPASKLVVLRSLSIFLQKALSSLEMESTSSIQKEKAPMNPNTNFDAIFMKNAFPSTEAFHAFESLIEPTLQNMARKGVSLTWKPEVSSDDSFGDLFTQDFPLLSGSGEPWSLHDLELVQDATRINVNLQNPHNASVEFVQRLAHTLHSTIIETYLDCAPSVFSPGSTPSETEVQLIVNILRITQTLYHAIFQSPDNVNPEHLLHLESIVNYMAPYFPAFTRDNKLDQSYEEFNLIYCELSSLVMTASQIETSRLNQKRKTQNRSSGGQKSRGPIQTERVTQYITRRLGGESVASSSQIGVPINPTAYRALLPTIWALISSTGTLTDESSEVVHAVLDHAVKTSSKSSCKRLTVEFVGRLMLLALEPHYHGVLSLDKNVELKGKFDAWFAHLPQVLWELGAANLPTTEITLRVLLRVLQRRSKTAQFDTIASLQSRLVPFFYIDHPTRGALPGPYKKLPALSASRVRTLVLDVVCTIMALGKQEGQEFEGLARAVGLAVAGEDEESYWTHVSSVLMNKK